MGDSPRISELGADRERTLTHDLSTVELPALDERTAVTSATRLLWPG
jgi:hypothetical protein